MPMQDGFAVLAELSHLSPTRPLPVLVLTSDVTLAAHRRALAAGARAVLVKPFERVDLLESVRILLQECLRERVPASDRARRAGAPAPVAGDGEALG
jgi:CheY-like chemotaxis protein